MQDCALAIIFNKEQKVVLLQRRDIPVWVLPGGGIEAAESAEQAVIREVEEETGLQVSIERKIAEYLPINRFTSSSTIFVCTIQGGDLRNSLESRKVAFFSTTQLPTLLFHYHRQWLSTALQSNHFVRQPMSKKIFYSVVFFYLRHPLWAIRYLFTRFSLNFFS